MNDGGLGGAANASGSAGAVNAGAGGSAGARPSGDPVVYVAGSADVSAYRFNRSTGEFVEIQAEAGLGPGPSYLAISPQDSRIVIVTNEDDGPMGGLTSAVVDNDGALSKVHHVTGSDGGFTHVAIAPNGNLALAASYNGGSVSVFSIGTDATLGGEIDNVDFGNGAQSHCVAFDREGTHVLVPNKGNDEVAQLLLGEEGMLTPNTPSSVATANGAGPRHIALHPNGTLAFVINELDSTMTPYRVSDSVTLTAGTPVSTLPAGFSGQNSGAHVELTPDGRFVYGSNRGHDSIVVFSADQATGALTFVEHEPSGGRTPRDFDMDPYGEFIVVANQQSSNLAAFRVEADGTLTPFGDPVSGPSGARGVLIAYLP
jgi:6-phosphogluconolactonase